MQIPTGKCCRSENPPLSNALQSPLEITNAIGRAMSKLTPKRQKKIENANSYTMGRVNK